MDTLIRIATVEIARFLEENLPRLSPDWWNRNVVERLSFQQQRMVAERDLKTLQQLDLAAVLRVLDQNWRELTALLSLCGEARSWVRELQAARNRWAHSSSENVLASDQYRNADTLARLIAALGSDSATLSAVESERVDALTQMSKDSQVSGQGGSAETAGEDHGSSGGFKVGDLVTLVSDPTVLLPVLEVIPQPAERRYRVFRDGAREIYYESQLKAVTNASDERQVLTAEQLRARLTALQLLSPSTANLFSLRSGRVRFVPYQYRPVLKLVRSDRPRLLIADEVGVGKTIEAGLIIKELQARTEINSVLVICPKALVAERKWFNEMRRFDEHFAELDGRLLRHCLRETNLEGEWPEQYAKAIVPFSLFDSDLIIGRNARGRNADPGLLALDPPPKFDLVIVDEAHHIRNTETYLYEGVRYFCDNAQSVLLLTATPVQLGRQDLFTLLNVIRPDLIIDTASFEQMAAPNQYINEAVRECRGAEGDWQSHARSSLAKVAGTEWGRRFVCESRGFQAAYDRLGEDSLDDSERVGLIHSIEELYTFSPLINRTRRRDIGEFTTRKPETIAIPFTAGQQALHDGVLDVIRQILARCHGQQNVKFMMTAIRRQAASCLYGLAPFLSEILNRNLNRLELMEAIDTEDESVTDTRFVDEVRADIEALLRRTQKLSDRDPKLEAFLRVLREKNVLPNNKAMVFSTFRHTLRYLDSHARAAGLRVGLIHGDVPDEQRASLRHQFSLPKEHSEAIDVLLSSEVGCEGLDFQFCDFLLNYDLPWNPMRIEQRIGRIDRYGQKSESIGIVNLITPGTVDAEIYDRCLWRIGVFHHAVGGSEEILGSITQQLHNVADITLTAEERSRQLKQIADNGIRQIREEQELEQKQAELFGLNVPRESWREAIQSAESFWLSPAAIQTSVQTYLAGRLGSDLAHLLGEKPLKTLRLSQEARNVLLEDFRALGRSQDPVSRQWERWLREGQPTLSVTFEQEAATESPRAAYLSVLHPLVRQAARFLEISEPECCRMQVDSDEVPGGTHCFALYRWSKTGIKPDEMLVPVCDEPKIEASLLTLLQTGADSSGPVPRSAEFDALDARHHSKWAAARVDHISENRELAAHRMQSLNASHAARRKSLGDQIASATNEKIRIMKESQLARANADFARRMREFEQSANSGDIRATPVVFGTISVTRKMVL
jgi:ERCC4-related helicase